MTAYEMRISDWSSDVCSSDLGPIIVTGGAIGSLIGQAVRVSPSQRKVLLASGAAAGMAATFGSPLAAVVLAIELLLFEFSARSFIPLVVASSVAGGVHAQLFGSGPLFTVPEHDFSGLGELPLFAAVRSEGHTYELQSLMRISYACFRLKKK